jgi:hypothetical protein
MIQTIKGLSYFTERQQPGVRRRPVLGAATDGGQMTTKTKKTTDIVVSE